MEEGPAKLVKMVDDIMKPVGKMDGDSLPVSAFVDHVTVHLNLAHLILRSAALPLWYLSGILTPAQMQQVCLCVSACHHPSVRYERRRGRSRTCQYEEKLQPVVKTDYTYTLAVSQWIVWDAACIGVCRLLRSRWYHANLWRQSRQYSITA